jgi:hypothetical protein
VACHRDLSAGHTTANGARLRPARSFELTGPPGHLGRRAGLAAGVAQDTSRRRPERQFESGRANAQLASPPLPALCIRRENDDLRVNGDWFGYTVNGD